MAAGHGAASSTKSGACPPSFRMPYERRWEPSTPSTTGSRSPSFRQQTTACGHNRNHRPVRRGGFRSADLRPGGDTLSATNTDAVARMLAACVADDVPAVAVADVAQSDADHGSRTASSPKWR